MAGLFIAGTDTGVGKTIITAGIAAYLRSRGENCGVMKPVESGCFSGDPKSDSVYLKQISKSPDDLDLITTYAFEKPLAPGVAAELEGVEISFERILDSYKRLSLLHSHLLVEGAGGLMVPLTRDQLLVDLIKSLGLPVLLVARMGLGTINHTLLSLEQLRHYQIPVVGIVLNCLEKKPDLSAHYNLSTLSKWTEVPIWGTMGLLRRRKDRKEIIAKLKAGIGREVDRYFQLK